MMSAHLGVHEQSEDLAPAGGIPIGMINGASSFSQHMLSIASDIVPQVQTLECESKGHEAAFSY